MLHETIQLFPDRPWVTLTGFVADQDPLCRDAMLVIPGGGYHFVASDREGDAIAMAYLARGFNAFVLRYTVDPEGHYPMELQEASAAVAYIRSQAERYHVNPQRVFAVGFSAGGHLCGMLDTMWHLPEAYEPLGIPYGSNKPTGVILCYGVLTTGPKGHRGSLCHLLGRTDISPEEAAYYSVEKHVDENTSPAFFMHTAADTVVPVENTLYAAEAMSAHKIPFEVHIFPYGQHGISLANRMSSEGHESMEDTSVEPWVDLSVKWTKRVPSLTPPETALRV